MSAMKDRLDAVLQKYQRAMVSTGEVPCKKKSKAKPYKLQNTFEKNLRGVPGGSKHQGASIVKQIAALETGTQTRATEIDPRTSARNCNTTQGNYNRTVIW